MMGLNRWRTSRRPSFHRHPARRRARRMIALDPVVLLLDEPRRAWRSESEMLGEILTPLKQQLDLTLVLIEHDIPLVMSLSDRIIAMERVR